MKVIFSIIFFSIFSVSILASAAEPVCNVQPKSGDRFGFPEEYTKEQTAQIHNEIEEALENLEWKFSAPYLVDLSNRSFSASFCDIVVFRGINTSADGLYESSNVYKLPLETLGVVYVVWTTPHDESDVTYLDVYTPDSKFLGGGVVDLDNWKKKYIEWTVQN